MVAMVRFASIAEIHPPDRTVSPAGPAAGQGLTSLLCEDGTQPILQVQWLELGQTSLLCKDGTQPVPQVHRLSQG